MTTLRPNYGDNYTDAKKTKMAFANGKEFIVVGMYEGEYRNGSHCSVRDFKKGEILELQYNYDKQTGKFRKTTSVTVSAQMKRPGKRHVIIR
tara:strand:+ start:82 stop:357 length:276 start_codon:yes stop_codon:yes gene_type:complete